MKTEEIAALRLAAQAHIQPDGTPHNWGASDKLWRAYRALATPANVLSLIGRLDTAQQEIAEQERQKFALVQESAAFKKAVAEDLGNLYEACGCISDEDMQEEIAAAADRLGVEMIQPAEQAAPDVPAPACSQNCSSCQKPKPRQHVSDILAEDGTPLVFTEGNYLTE